MKQKDNVNNKYKKINEKEYIINKYKKYKFDKKCNEKIKI